MRALKAMREERRRRRERQGVARIQAQEAERSGTLVIEARNVSFGYGDRLVVQDLSTTILRGDKVGMIGANAVRKNHLDPAACSASFHPKQGQSGTVHGWKLHTSTS